MKKPKKKSKQTTVTIELKEVAAMLREHIALLEDAKTHVDTCTCYSLDDKFANKLALRLTLALGQSDRAASVEQE